MENDYVGDEKFFECIELLRNKISSNSFTDSIKQEIYETLMCYINDKHSINPETLKWLFTGYIMNSMIKNDATS